MTHDREDILGNKEKEKQSGENGGEKKKKKEKYFQIGSGPDCRLRRGQAPYH